MIYFYFITIPLHLLTSNEDKNEERSMFTVVVGKEMKDMRRSNTL